MTTTRGNGSAGRSPVTMGAVPTYAATAALPYPHLERATVRLRAQLTARLLQAGSAEPPDWAGLKVTGPEESPDCYARPWFWYRGTLQVSPVRPGAS